MTLALYGKSKRRQAGLLASALIAVLLATMAAVLWLGTARADAVTGGVNTTTAGGVVQDGNTKYTAKCDVYLKAAQVGGNNLGPDGIWYIHVVDPSGATVLTPGVGFITATVTKGDFASYLDASAVSHVAIGGVVPLCAIGTYADTPNNGGEYKAEASYNDSTFKGGNKADNFKVNVAPPTISKTQSSQVSDDSAKFYWAISVANPAGSPQTVRVSDTGATFVAQTSPNPASGTCTGLGVDCTVAASQTLIIRVSKPKPAAICSPQTVPNTAILSVVDGTAVTQVGTSTATPDYTVPASTGEQCASKGTLTVRKVGNFAAGLAPAGFSGPITGTTSGTWSADVGGSDSKTVTAGTGYGVSETTTGFPLSVTGGTVTGAQYKVLASSTDQCGTTGFSAIAPTGLTVSVGGETVVCVQNTFEATQVLQGSVVVKKDYVLNGGTKVVPVVHVEDLFDPTPNIDAGGVNDATHSQWEPVPVNTSGIVTVWEDLPAGWTTNGPPTVSGSCEVAQLSFLTAGELLQSSEQLAADVSDPNAIVELTVRTDGTCIVTFHNVRIETSRKIRIGKVTATATHPAEAFTGTIAPGAPTTFSASLPANAGTGPIGEYVMSSQVAQVVTETNIPANWTLDGYAVTSDTDDVKTCSPTASYTGTSASVPAGSGTYLVCIKNTYTPPIVPPGAITVTKTTTLNGSPQPQERIGWHIQVTSAACSVNLTQDTDAAGKATFSNLPVCNDYVVSEDTGNAPFAGYTAVTASTVTAVAVTSNGNTPVGFTNNRVFNPPPICQFGCSPVIISTPTAPPPTPTIVPPTPTVAPPTPTPTKAVDVVAGEKTPGAIATPLAPSTGSGFFGGDG